MRAQSVLQYVLVVAVVSVVALGILQTRFDGFKQGMESIRGEMVSYIGGNRRLPERWYGVETNPFEGTGGGGEEPAGTEPGGDSAGGQTSPETGSGEGLEGATGDLAQRRSQGGGGGSEFFAGTTDTGLSADSLAGADTRGGSSGIKSQRESRGRTEPFEFEDTEGARVDRDGRSLVGQGTERLREGREVPSTPAKTEEMGEEGPAAQLRKIEGDEPQARRGGELGFDWSTLLKLLLLVAIMVLLVIILLGTLGKKADKE
jgi:hypothetical protein